MHPYLLRKKRTIFERKKKKKRNSLGDASLSVSLFPLFFLSPIPSRSLFHYMIYRKGIGNSWYIAYIKSFGLQKSASIYSLFWSSMSPQTRPNWARKVHEWIIDMAQNNRRYGKVFFYILYEKERGRKTRKIFDKGVYIFSAVKEE